MIRLKLMKEWFDRVDDRRSALADQLAAPWFDGDASVRCGPASSNIVCRVTTETRTWYLRCNHESERTAATYLAEMTFVEYLAARGIQVARPVRSKAGALVESVPTELGVFHAVLLEEAPGEERELRDMDATSLHTWGREMARLHTAAAAYEGGGRPDWRDHLAFARDSIPATEEAARAELLFVMGVLEGLGTDVSSYGLIHFDMEADNMRWLGGAPTMFDFDDCARYWFVADVAYALRDLYEDRIEQIDLADRRVRAFVEGYRSERSLPEPALRQLPLFVRVHNLYWFARLHRSIASGVVPGEEQWTTDLRAQLIRTMNSYREGFEEHPVRHYLA